MGCIGFLAAMLSTTTAPYQGQTKADEIAAHESLCCVNLPEEMRGFVSKRRNCFATLGCCQEATVPTPAHLNDGASPSLLVAQRLHQQSKGGVCCPRLG